MDLKDQVEVFFEEAVGITVVEDAVAGNVGAFEAKFQGAVPVPKKFAPEWSVVLRSDVVEIGGSKVEVSICRPAVAGRDGLKEDVSYFLSTLEPSKAEEESEMKITLDGKEVVLKRGVDYWVNTVAKLRDTKTVSWL